MVFGEGFQHAIDNERLQREFERREALRIAEEMTRQQREADHKAREAAIQRQAHQLRNERIWREMHPGQ